MHVRKQVLEAFTHALRCHVYHWHVYRNDALPGYIARLVTFYHLIHWTLAQGQY